MTIKLYLLPSCTMMPRPSLGNESKWLFPTGCPLAISFPSVRSATPLTSSLYITPLPLRIINSVPALAISFSPGFSVTTDTVFSTTVVSSLSDGFGFSVAGGVVGVVGFVGGVVGVLPPPPSAFWICWST